MKTQISGFFFSCSCTIRTCTESIIGRTIRFGRAIELSGRSITSTRLVLVERWSLATRIHRQYAQHRHRTTASRNATRWVSASYTSHTRPSSANIKIYSECRHFDFVFTLLGSFHRPQAEIWHHRTTNWLQGHYATHNPFIFIGRCWNVSLCQHEFIGSCWRHIAVIR